MDNLERLAFLDPDFEDGGQPSEYEEWQDYFGGLGVEEYGTYGADPNGQDPDLEGDGQPSEYDEWQDYMGGDDWDQGQYDMGDEW
mgnify:CR=1 FL=1|jgi:hypothetical protein